MFKGASGVNIIGGSFSIIGGENWQTWRTGATANPADQKTAGNNCAVSSEDSLGRPTNRPTFNTASNVNINEGRSNTTIDPENISDAADPGVDFVATLWLYFINQPSIASQASYQSMFMDAENVNVENGVFTIVAGHQFNIQHEDIEAYTKDVKPMYVYPSGVQGHTLTGYLDPLHTQGYDTQVVKQSGQTRCVAVYQWN